MVGPARFELATPSGLPKLYILLVELLLGGKQMKMKQKGIATAAIVVVIVVVVAVAGVGAFLALRGGGGGAPGGLPEYPGATGYDVPAALQSTLPAGASVKGYSTSASTSDVITWYKANMSGWTLDNHSLEASGILYFTKGSDAAAIYTVSYSGTTIIVLYTGSTDTILA